MVKSLKFLTRLTPIALCLDFTIFVIFLFSVLYFSLSSIAFVFSLVHGGGFRRGFAFWVPKASIKPQKAASGALQSPRFAFILSLSLSTCHLTLSKSETRLLFKRVFLSFSLYLFSPLFFHFLCLSAKIVFALNIWFL